MSAGEILEAELAKSLGVARKELARVRQNLRADVDWRKEPAGIVLTAAGTQAVMAALAAEAKKNSAPAPSAAPAALAALPSRLPARRAQLTCTTVWKLNPHIIDALVEGEKAPQRVRVRDNKNFLPGMVFRAVQLSTGLWALDQGLPRHARDPQFWPKKISTPATPATPSPAVPAVPAPAEDDPTDPRPPPAPLS